VTATPALAAPTEPDPVIGLMEAHRTAWARYIELEDDIPWATEQAVAEAADAALDEILRTPPPPRAVLQYLSELDSDGSGFEMGGRYLPTLLRSPLLAS
jgi:hypothetical protein